jgi:hypothetical protein
MRKMQPTKMRQPFESQGYLYITFYWTQHLSSELTMQVSAGNDYRDNKRQHLSSQRGYHIVSIMNATG